MKTKQELEKEFDEFYIDLNDGTPSDNELKQFIFDTIIPEVLKNIIIDENQKNEAHYLDICHNIARMELLGEIKQKAKELYNINL